MLRFMTAHWSSARSAVASALVVLTTVLGGSPASAQLAGLEYAGEIYLSESAVVAQVSEIDRAEDGRLLITDQIGNTVFLFDPEGGLIAELNPAPCELHYAYRPIYARFVQGDIIVVNSDADHWGLRFDEEGNCVDRLDPSFVAPQGLTLEDEGSLYGFYPSEMLIRRLSSDGATISEQPIPDTRFKNAAGLFMGGGVVALRDELYVALPMGDAVLVLAAGGEELRRLSLSHAGIQIPPADLSGEVGPDLFPEIDDFLGEATWVVDISEIASGLMMIQFRHPDRTRGYVMIDQDGSLHHHHLGLERTFSYVGHGVALYSVQPEVDDQGHLPNPFLREYRFTPNTD